MALTDAQLQALIVAEVGDLNGIVSTNITTMWAMYAQYGSTFGLLQYYYAKRQAIQLLMGQVREQVTFETIGDLKMNLSDKLKGLITMFDEVSLQIQTAKQQARANRPAASGQITQVEPVTPPYATTPDAGDQRYIGNPYVPITNPQPT